MQIIDSESVGEAARFLSAPALESAFAELASAPTRIGRVCAMVTREQFGRRRFLRSAELKPRAGMPGDRWETQAQPKEDQSLAVMQYSLAQLIANGQSIALFGDNLFLDLDLSIANLPIGRRIQIGNALLEVSPEPHNGCAKFQARFGRDALCFISSRERRHLRLRGIYLKTVAMGQISVGDWACVIS